MAWTKTQSFITVLLTLRQMSSLSGGVAHSFSSDVFALLVFILLLFFPLVSDGLAWCLQILLLQSDQPSSYHKCQHPNTPPVATAEPSTLMLSSLSGYPFPGPQKVTSLFLTRLGVMKGHNLVLHQPHWSLHLNKITRPTQDTSSHVHYVPEIPRMPLDRSQGGQALPPWFEQNWILMQAGLLVTCWYPSVPRWTDKLNIDFDPHIWWDNQCSQKGGQLSWFAWDCPGFSTDSPVFQGNSQSQENQNNWSLSPSAKVEKIKLKICLQGELDLRWR